MRARAVGKWFESHWRERRETSVDHWRPLVDDGIDTIYFRWPDGGEPELANATTRHQQFLAAHGAVHEAWRSALLGEMYGCLRHSKCLALTGGLGL